jgi:hypothetical protein
LRLLFRFRKFLSFIHRLTFASGAFNKLHRAILPLPSGLFSLNNETYLGSLLAVRLSLRIDGAQAGSMPRRGRILMRHRVYSCTYQLLSAAARPISPTCATRTVLLSLLTKISRARRQIEVPRRPP